MNKALIIQTRPGVGDLCMFLAYMQQIHQNNQELEITLITQKRTSAKQVLKYEKSIKEIIYLEDDVLKINKSKINNFFNLINFINKNNFLKIYIMHFSLFWFLVSKISKIKNIYIYGAFKKNVDIYLNALDQNKKWLNNNNLSSQAKISWPT